MTSATAATLEGGVVSERLAALNRTLAGMFPRRGPAPLVSDGDASRDDALILCGLLGGKDVGKSTLINAIARAPVSEDEEEVGRGTACPVAYVHEDEVRTLRLRFAAGGGAAPDLRMRTHKLDAVRNLVLLDLPDFDSTFGHHLEIVRDAVGRVDRVIWLCDPKKIGDRLWGELLPRVVKDPANVYCVLNKFDLLLDDDDAEHGLAGAHERARAYLAQSLTSLDVGGDPRQRFILSAAFTDADAFSRAVAKSWGDEGWQRFAHARGTVRELGRAAAAELERMREMIQAPVAPERVRSIKLANQRAVARANAEAIRRHFAMDRHLEAVGQALAGLAGELQSRFDHDFLAAVAGRLTRLGRSDADLADEVTAYRVERWPILSAMFWSFRGVIRWLGRRMAAPAGDVPGAADAWRVRGVSLEDRLGAMQVSLRSRFVGLLDEMKLDADWPGAEPQGRRVRGETAAAVEQMDGQIIEACRAECHPVGTMKKCLAWLPLLWFPLLQPLAEGLLATVAAQGMITTVHGLSLVVRALGAASLLRGLLVALLLYAFALAAMYARSMRAVRRARRGTATAPDAEEEPTGAHEALLHQVLADEVLAPLAAPLEAAHRRLAEIDAALKALRVEPIPGYGSSPAA